MRRSGMVALTLLWLLLTLEVPVTAEIIYGITESTGQFFSFDSATPGTILALHQVTGLIGDDAIDGGIDLRPANGKVYGVSQHSRIYAIDPATGIATLASTLSSPLPLPAFLSVNGIDFDPVSDRLRVVTFSSPTRNLLIDVDTGETIDQGRVSFARAIPRVLGIRMYLVSLTTTILLQQLLPRSTL